MNRKRDERGKFVESVTRERVLKALWEIGPQATATDVGELLGCTREAAYKKLVELHDRGIVERRKVGGRAVTWWDPKALSYTERDLETTDLDSPKDTETEKRGTNTTAGASGGRTGIDPGAAFWTAEPGPGSGRSDVSRNVDEHLYGERGDEADD